MAFKVKLLNSEHPTATQTIDAVEDPRNAALLFAALWCKLNGKSPIIEVKALGEP